MKNIPLLLGTLIGTFLLVFVVAFMFSNKAGAPVEQTRLLGDAHNATGSAQPKVTIVEFSDLQCPACKAAQPLVKKIVEANPNEVKLVYRHFPLSQHKYAQLAALAAETAGSMGKFWPYHDRLFEQQEVWGTETQENVLNIFKDFAKEFSIPPDLMEQSLKTKTFEQKVAQDIADGTALGVNSTPTFFVNGQRTQTADLQSTVEKYLK
ncbi:MAG: thioredoxin domain-containing protein [Candidatus Pacebacteria bacterium]|nr:thioredoxin domain-containing protein [Candidatus Paceibacterota bacterium]